MFGFLFLGIYIGGANIFYYSIPLMIFTSIGLAGIGAGIDSILKKNVNKNKNRHLAVETMEKAKYNVVSCLTVAGSMILCLIGSYNLSMNTDYMKIDKEEMFLYQFRDIVKQEKNPTLLNVNMLDAGLYTVADIVPSEKFFQTNGIAYEKMFEEQERYIREGLTQFVICRFEYPEYILDKYELVAESSFMTDGKNESMYYLFKRRED